MQIFFKYKDRIYELNQLFVFCINYNSYAKLRRKMEQHTNTEWQKVRWQKKMRCDKNSGTRGKLCKLPWPITWLTEVVKWPCLLGALVAIMEMVCWKIHCFSLQQKRAFVHKENCHRFFSSIPWACFQSIPGRASRFLSSRWYQTSYKGRLE